ncbi:hypothetical protein D3C87_1676100 [compost metagenome]
MGQRAIHNFLHRLKVKSLSWAAATSGKRNNQRIHIHQRIEIVRIANQLRFQA